MIRLLPLNLTHCERVYEIAKECLPEHWSLDGIRDVLKYKNNVYYVAYSTEHQMVVGFAGIMVIEGEAELLNIAVDEAFRGQKIAGRLLERLLLEAKSLGARRMLLEVRESNISAKALYTQFSFLPIGIRKGYYHNPKEDAVIMEYQYL